MMLRAGRLAAIMAILVSVGLTMAAAQDRADGEALRVLALDLVNKARADHKLPPLRIGKQIDAAARFHAADMLRRNFYDHSSPEGKTVQDRFVNAGGSRWRITAENIARCTGCDVSAKTVEELQRGWMNSKGHRENILRKGVSEFGFSIVTDAGRPLYAVQTFTGAGTPNDLAGAGAAKRLSEAETAAKALEIFNTERNAAGRPPLAENANLTKALRSMLSRQKLEDFSLERIGKVTDALAPADRNAWQNLAILAAACGGCGDEPTDADLRAFLRQWLAKAGNKAIIIDPASTHLGFVLAASGEGKKVALAVFGRKQPE